MVDGTELWGAVWMAFALALTGTSVVCGLASCRRLRRSRRAIIAAVVALGMVVSALDMALPGTLLSPLGWAAVLLALMLVSLTGLQPDTVGGAGRGAARRGAAQHAAGLLFMAVMWLAMLPAVPVLESDAPATLHAAHAQATGSLLLPLGWMLIAASVLVVVLVVRGRAGRPGPNRRWAAAQHASMGLAMSAMTAGMIVPMMFS